MLCAPPVCSWPAIYNNLQNMDYCTTTFAHLGNRKYLALLRAGGGYAPLRAQR
jgi:hypothetical protein